MELNKKSLAGIGAAAAAIVVLTGGYAVSFANYSSTLDKARFGIEQIIANSAQVDPKDISVEFFEQKTGLFNHDVTLVIHDGQNSFKIPMNIGVGYANYTFDIDLVNSYVNKENAIKYYELNDLTKLEAYGKLNLLSGKLNFTSNVSFLNHSTELEHFAKANAFALFQKEKAQEALQRAKVIKARQDAEAAKALEREKKAALNVTLESNRAKARLAAQSQDQSDAQAQAQVDAQAQSEAPAQELAKTKAPAPADAQAQAPAQLSAEAQAIAQAQVPNEAQVFAEAQAEVQSIAQSDANAPALANSQGNDSELNAIDKQEIDSVETIENTPVTADMDTQGAALEAEKEILAKAQDKVDVLPENEQDEPKIEIVELDPKDDNVALAQDDSQDELDLDGLDLEALPQEKVPTVTYKYDKNLSMDDNLLALKKMQELAIRNDQAKDDAKLALLAEQELAKLKETIGFKQIGNVIFNVIIDSDEKIHTSINIDHFSKSGAGLSNLNLYRESQGILSLVDFGLIEAAVDKAYTLTYSNISYVDNAVMKLKSSRPTKSGNFSLDYSIKADSLDVYKYVDISGRLLGLNVKVANSDDPIDALAAVIKENGLELSFNKGSSYAVGSFVRKDKNTDPVAQDIKITFDGSLSVAKGSDFYLFATLPIGVINFNLDTPIDLVVDPAFTSPQEVAAGFEVKDGKSYGKVEFVESGLIVNGFSIY